LPRTFAMHPLSNFTSITVTSFRVKVTCAQKSFRRDFFSDLFATALATSLFPERLFHHAVQRVPKLTSTGVLMVLKMCPARGRVTVARRPLPGLSKSGEAPHRQREGQGFAIGFSGGVSLYRTQRPAPCGALCPKKRRRATPPAATPTASRCSPRSGALGLCWAT
jgi:hypothetical protein